MYYPPQGPPPGQGSPPWGGYQQPPQWQPPPQPYPPQPYGYHQPQSSYPGPSHSPYPPAPYPQYSQYPPPSTPPYGHTPPPRHPSHHHTLSAPQNGKVLNMPKKKKKTFATSSLTIKQDFLVHIPRICLQPHPRILSNSVEVLHQTIDSSTQLVPVAAGLC